MRAFNGNGILLNLSKPEIVIGFVTILVKNVERMQLSYVNNEEVVIGLILCSSIPPRVL